MEKARFNMVHQQIRPWRIFDARVLDLMMMFPRENFVPEKYAPVAFADMNIPLSSNQQMWSPKIIGRCLQEIQLLGFEHVLEIGTGSGYLTALLAKRAKQVTTIEYFKDLSEAAENKIKELDIENVNFIQGDFFKDFHITKTFDVIVVTGSVPYLPEQITKCLDVGGRIFAIIGSYPVMKASLLTRMDKEGWGEQHLFETAMEPLLNVPTGDNFVF